MSILLDNKIEQELELPHTSNERFRNLFIPPDQIEGDEKAKFSLKSWWSCLQAHRFKPTRERIKLYERALLFLPGNYKIWHSYLSESIEDVSLKPVISKRYQNVNDLFERALKFLEKMPRIWLMYFEFLIKQNIVSKTRENFDKALGSLPVTQHHLIWEPFVEWVMELPLILTTKNVLTRYVQIEPDFKDEFADYLLRHNDIDGAALIHYQILRDDKHVSKSGKSKFQYYLDLCNMIIEKPTEKSINCELIIREGIKKYIDEVGNLWVKLAQYFIKLGQFQKARDAYEESMQKVITARDFGIVFNAYMKFEEELVNALALGNQEDEEDVNEQELEDEMKILDDLIERRPHLLNDVMLRQNPNSIPEWLKKIQLNYKNVEYLLQIFSEALSFLDPPDAEGGSVSEIWIKFAEFYHEQQDLKNSNLIYHKATQVNYKTIQELQQIWITWIEMLIKEQFYEDALLVVKQALFTKRLKNGAIDEGEETEQKQKDQKQDESQQQYVSLYHNVTLWTLYIDLERNFGTFDTIKLAYRKCLDIKVITPFMLLNFVQYLEDNHYYEDSFKVFEKGIQLFNWPLCFDIWVVYIHKFVARYGSEKLERTRDLFEKVLVSVPEKQCKIFYLMYADFEEQYGLLNHAFEIYDRMVVNVQETDRIDAYNIYIAKISHYLGITKTRPIFESAIEKFQGNQLVDLGLRFAHLERKLGEIDRARAIYIHISQFTDPRDDDKNLWKIWNDFEVHHGNVDTFKEYMRIKRSVLNKYNLLPPDPEKIKQKVERGEL